jgi:lipopolysaccharide export system protein LptA
MLALSFSVVVVGLVSADDTFSFKADRMTGGRAVGKETTVLIGNAEIHSDKMVVHADRIELYGKNNNFAECIGNVSGMEKENEISFTADHLQYDRSSKVSAFEGNSSMEDKKNGVVARGRYIKYNQDTEVAILQVSVRMFKEKMVCRAEYAVYRRKTDMLDLAGFPVVYKGDDEFRADRIRVNLKTDEVLMQGAVSGNIKGDGKEDKKEPSNDETSPATTQKPEPSPREIPPETSTKPETKTPPAATTKAKPESPANASEAQTAEKAKSKAKSPTKPKKPAKPATKPKQEES